MTWWWLLPLVALVLLALNQWRLVRLRRAQDALLRGEPLCDEPGCHRPAHDPVHDWAGGSCCGAHGPMADVPDDEEEARA